MVNSERCHLRNLSRDELVAHKEEANEHGGYFIINGIERLIRLLVVQRRNHPMALIRPSFTNREKGFTEYGVTMRCVRPDQTSQSVALHYLASGSCRLRVTLQKQVLRSLSAYRPVGLCFCLFVRA